MTEPTPTTLGEILNYLTDNVALIRHRVELRHLKPADGYTHNERLKAEATQSIQEQLKALLPEKHKASKANPDNGDSNHSFRLGRNEAIDQIEKAIEEWAK